MTTPISNNTPPSFTPAAAGARGGGSAASAGATTDHAGPDGRIDDQIKLTDSALALQNAARPQGGAMVDQQRVEQIRAAIADGSYTINPTQIAGKMLALEQQLNGAIKA